MAHLKWVTWGTVQYNHHYLQASRDERREWLLQVRGKDCRRSHSADTMGISQDNQHGMQLEEVIIQPHSPLSLLSPEYVLY